MREALKKGRQLAQHTVAVAEAGAVENEDEDIDLDVESDEKEEDSYEENSSADEMDGPFEDEDTYPSVESVN